MVQKTNAPACNSKTIQQNTKLNTRAPICIIECTSLFFFTFRAYTKVLFYSLQEIYRPLVSRKCSTKCRNYFENLEELCTNKSIFLSAANAQKPTIIQQSPTYLFLKNLFVSFKREDDIPYQSNNISSKNLKLMTY